MQSALRRRPKRTVSWTSLLKYRTTWGMMLANAGYLYIYYVFATWLPGYLVIARHMTILKGGFVGVLPFAVGFAVTILGGWFGDVLLQRGVRRTVVRKGIAIAGLLTATLFTVLAAFATGTWTAVTFLTLAVAGFSFSTAALQAIPVDVAPQKLVSSLAGLHNFGGNVAASFAPFITGLLLQTTGTFSRTVARDGGHRPRAGRVADHLRNRQSRSRTRRPGDGMSGILKRRLGRTGVDVSMVGLGGFHIGQPNMPGGDAIKLMHAAVDRGITFFDNSWDYNAGNSENRMGQALQFPGYRERVFLMTKIDGRSKDGFTKQLDESLNRLIVDHVDLIQFHEVIRMEDVDRIFADGGAIDAAKAAREAGKVRFIGFTGHKHPSIHLHMIETAAKYDFVFDTVQMPLNIMDAHFESFGANVVPVAQKLDMGIIGMKTFGDHFILDTKAVDPIDMLHYGMNLPTSVVVTGIDTPEVLDQAVRAAESFAPLSEKKLADILAAAAPYAAAGAAELYKSTHYFDSTVQHPAWLD